jgi:pyruvate kinase
MCNRVSKPVITATQMLSSMVDNPRPSRAEASDVYNAIVDGTDAVMLSNETASGQFPVEAVMTMARIAQRAETHIFERKVIRNEVNVRVGEDAIADSICEATFSIAEALKARAIITASLSGRTAQRVASERPGTPVLCVTPSETTYRRMALVWGVTPVLVAQFTTIDEMLRVVTTQARAMGNLRDDDVMVIVAGVPFGPSGKTNLLKVHRVGDSFPA